MEWEEQFSKEHPLKIKDTDLFLHGTSSKNYSAIQRTGFLLREAPSTNWSVSRKGICFEKYVRRGKYYGASSAGIVDLTINHYCEIACERDGSLEGVVLQIKGRELKKLGCSIYVDWSKPYDFKTVEGVPIDVDLDVTVLSIIVLDCDIPPRYLEVVKRISYEQLETRFQF